MTCLFDPFGCLQAGVYMALAGVPWWVWGLVILAVFGLAWRLAGWPGVVAAAAGLGYLFGRNPRMLNPKAPEKQAPPPKKKHKTLQDVFGQRWPK